MIEAPFVGIEVLRYYSNWIVWTLLTFPMAYLGYYLKKGNFFSVLVFLPIILLLSYHVVGYFKMSYLTFPRHLLSSIFCVFQLIMFILILFDKKKRIINFILTIICVILSAFLIFRTNIDFVTNNLLPNKELNINDNWEVSLKNEDIGSAYIMNGELYLHIINYGEGNLKLTDEEGNTYNYNFVVKKDESIEMEATD